MISAATLLTGVLQILAGAFKLGVLMRFVSRSVITGFVNALDKVILKFRREGTVVEIIGMNQASATLMDRLGVHDKPDAVEKLMGH